MTTTLAPDDFSYRIVRSGRKSAAIHVRQGQVEVRIPHYVDDHWATEFLHSKHAWVRGKLDQQAQQLAMRPSIEQGQRILWQGQWRTLTLSGELRGVKVAADNVLVGAADEQLRPALERFFKSQARAHMVARTWAIAEQYGLEHKLNHIQFRRTKSKWGHCTSRGQIQYNWLIMGAPMAVIDYLICHEVCHLQHPNHSAAFWQCVARYCPDYKQHQGWLKHNSASLNWQ